MRCCILPWITIRNRKYSMEITFQKCICNSVLLLNPYNQNGNTTYVCTMINSQVYLSQHIILLNDLI